MVLLAYNLTMLVGCVLLGLALFGVTTDLRNGTYPQTRGEWAFMLGLLAVSASMVVTAAKALWQ